jgi:hypothetical protein
MQFALISLIPGLIRHLQDSADPKFNSCEENLVTPTSLKTSERASREFFRVLSDAKLILLVLAYMGLPLQLFGKGSLFGPYTPLQQLDMLADQDTKSYIVGSTNSLLLQQRDRYSDILINLDEHTVNTTSTSLRQASILSTPDRRWIDFLTQTVNDTWDESNPSRPKDHGFPGSEEFIRMQFEEYLLAMLSSVKTLHGQERAQGALHLRRRRRPGQRILPRLGARLAANRKLPHLEPAHGLAPLRHCRPQAPLLRRPQHRGRAAAPRTVRLPPPSRTKSHYLLLTPFFSLLQNPVFRAVSLGVCVLILAWRLGR